MSWTERFNKFLGVQSKEQRAEMHARHDAEIAAYADALARDAIIKAAKNKEEVRLGIETELDGAKKDISLSGSRMADITIDTLSSIASSTTRDIDDGFEDIFLNKVLDSTKRDELRKLGLQAAESYWIGVLSQTPVSLTAVRVGSRRLGEIRTQLNPPQSNPNQGK